MNTQTTQKRKPSAKKAPANVSTFEVPYICPSSDGTKVTVAVGTYKIGDVIISAPRAGYENRPSTKYTVSSLGKSWVDAKDCAVQYAYLSQI